MTPPKGTPEYELWIAATEVAASAPLRAGTHSFSAQVPWYLIKQLRDALDQLGIDWREVKRIETAESARRRTG